MKFKYIVFLLTLFPIHIAVYSQIQFEEGYIITENGDRIECFIKNMGWRRNPVSIDFYQGSKESIETLSINQIQEFCIGSTLKYVKANVKIDLSSSDKFKLSNHPNPEWEERQVLLQVMVEGRPSLFSFREKGEVRFFFSSENDSIEQLIYKEFKDKNGDIRFNRQYQQQLSQNVRCENQGETGIDKLRYSKSDLVKFFLDYHDCMEIKAINYSTSYVIKDNIHLSLSLGTRKSQMQTGFKDAQENLINFENKRALEFGLELEIMFPSTRNKWSFYIKPTYQKYEPSNITIAGLSPEPNSVTPEPITLKYHSVEFPFGIKRYFFLQPSHKLFLKLGVLLDRSFGPGVDVSSFDQFGLHIRSQSNFVYGMGYQFKKIFMIEWRGYTRRRVLVEYWNWTFFYKSNSVVLSIGIL